MSKKRLSKQLKTALAAAQEEARNGDFSSQIVYVDRPRRWLPILLFPLTFLTAAMDFIISGLIIALVAGIGAWYLGYISDTLVAETIVSISDRILQIFILVAGV
ncbi:hypothetical protein ACQU0X_26570 [Pseudovibrio ascidiaceicola]|uniref:hypothetical protein n=1 Tax=Pseudovibrio ascidiaceicola TaxID=285279 RepID=UPI003D36FC07